MLNANHVHACPLPININDTLVIPHAAQALGQWPLLVALLEGHEHAVYNIDRASASAAMVELRL